MQVWYENDCLVMSNVVCSCIDNVNGPLKTVLGATHGTEETAAEKCGYDKDNCEKYK